MTSATPPGSAGQPAEPLPLPLEERETEANPETFKLLGLLKATDFDSEAEPPVLRGPLAEGKKATSLLPQVGEVVAERFKIEALLGEGGAGAVFRALDQELQRKVAIKFLRLARPELRARFLREAALTAGLRHRNVLSLFDSGEAEGRLYIVYELVEGARDLSSAFAERDLEARLDLFEQALEGVAAAHAAGVIHRDLKPENILVRSPDHVLVADFGLAKTEESSLTNTGQWLGTPAYMSPEQVVGQPVTPATDVWALGLILHEVLYETHPLLSESDSDIRTLIVRIRVAEFTPPSEGPVALRQLLFNEVLRRDAGDRLPDAGEFLERFRAARAQVKVTTSSRPLGLVVLQGAGLLALAALSFGLGRGSIAQPLPSAQIAASDSAVGALPGRSASSSPGSNFKTRAYYRARLELKTAPHERLLTAAKEGQPAAMRILARRLFYGYGHGVEADLAGGQAWAERAAKLGCAESMFDLSTYHAEQVGPFHVRKAKEWRVRAREAGVLRVFLRDFARGPSEALQRARDAIERGDDEAAAQLAGAYFGIGDRARALDWANFASALGSPEGRSLRGLLELTKFKPDYEAALRDLEFGRVAWDPVAISTSAYLLLRGCPSQARDLEAARRLVSSPGLEREHPDVMVMILMLELSDGGRRRFPGDEIERRLALCSARASTHAKGMLGLFFWHSWKRPDASDSWRAKWKKHARRFLQEGWLSPNPRVPLALAMGIDSGEFPLPNSARRVCELYQRAARLEDPQGYRLYGRALIFGHGTPRDTAKGLQLTKRAARGGDAVAWRNLAIFYDDEDFSDYYDVKESQRCARLAAEGGDLQGMNRYGYLLVRLKRLKEGRRWFAEAARAGNVDAIANLAITQLRGQGGPKDPAAALRALHAIKEHNSRSSAVLARCYRQGLGVEQDPAQGAIWRKRSEELKRAEQAAKKRRRGK
ncbi:MAG: protein kinase [Planctomycetes bacterium]|nr:protein kinase [Planctomycetota bacterium]